MSAASEASGEGRTVLVVNLPEDLLQRVAPILSRARFDTNVVSSFPSAASLIELLAFDVLVVSDPTEESADGESFLEALRSPGGACGRSTLLALCREGRVQKVRRSLSDRLARVVSTTVDDDTLAGELSAVLRVAPRLSVRLTIRLMASLADGRSEIMTQTDNVSRTGMLLRARRVLPVRSQSRFELVQAGGGHPIRGVSEVVRHAMNGRETVGMGLRFLGFDDDGRERLERILQETERRSTG